MLSSGRERLHPKTHDCDAVVLKGPFMERSARWAIGLLLPILLSACTTAQGSATGTRPADERAALFLQLDKPVHFTAPDGTPVLVPSDDYLVEQTTDAQLRLVPSSGGSPLLLAAEQVTHDIDLSAPIPLLAFNDDARNVVLLMPNGTALDAAGSLSGLLTRGIVRPKRRYQLAYQLNPATGEITFGDGVTGQRLPTSQSNVSANYRAGAGALGNVGASTSAESELHLIQLQSLVSQRQQAIALASNVSAALNQGFRLEYNTDRPGNDYGQRATNSAEACRTICSADGNCQAFTFVKPPAGSSTGLCFLKRTVPTPVGNSCCISAKRKSTQDEMIGNIGK